MSEKGKREPSGIGILGLGSFAPEGVLTNFDLEKMVDTSDQWIRERTGIERRHRAEDHIATSDTASEAGRRAMEDAGVGPEDIDLVIVGTATPDMFFPSTACLVQKNLGTRKAAAFDLSAACSGFLYGLTIAKGFIESGTYKRCLIIGAETLTRILDWDDRATCVLFGDGAGAAVVGKVGDGRGIISTYIGSDGSLYELLLQPAGGTRMPASEETLKNKMHHVHMQGNTLFKYAVKAMGDAAMKTLTDAGYSGDELDLLIPHQANLRIIDATARRIHVPKKKVFVNLQEYGNTSAASIPLALDDARRQGVLKDGMLINLVAFGAGLTWGSILMRW
ncbi:MAG: beta-ketoacyl-ACP synthase III [bacterium]|jgi:3-oxoacyl-[acyl-carrier-protein] synthase-3